jgi:hypothetical protein
MGMAKKRDQTSGYGPSETYGGYYLDTVAYILVRICNRNGVFRMFLSSSRLSHC